jgi:hypothetical protein
MEVIFLHDEKLALKKKTHSKKYFEKRERQSNKNVASQEEMTAECWEEPHNF